MSKLTLNNWYRFKEMDGTEHVGQYTGNDQGFECCVCGKGCKARTFNIWNSEDDWETWGYGRDHMPEILEDLGTSDEVIVDR